MNDLSQIDMVPVVTPKSKTVIFMTGIILQCISIHMKAMKEVNILQSCPDGFLNDTVC